MDTARVSNFAALARIEWFELLIFTFPMTLVLPILGLINGGPELAFVFVIHSSLPVIGAALIYFIVGLIVSSIIDKWRLLSSKTVPQTLPYDKDRQLKQILSEVFGDRRGIKVEDILWYPHDLLMGAHVRGVIKPQIIVSAGLLLGLLRKNPKAIGILAHEIAHIQHYDCLLPGLIGMAVIELFGTTAAYYSDIAGTLEGSNSLVAVGGLFIYKLLVFGGLICIMSRSRETYADASAAQHLPNDEYVTLLQGTRGAEKDRYSFFHPSMPKRITDGQNRFAGLQNRWLWRAYFVAATATAWFQLSQMRTTDLHDGVFEYIYSTFYMGLAVLALEIFRRPLMRSRARFQVSTPSLPRPLLRLLFLIVGFGCAAYVAAEVSNPTVGSIIGAVVYAVFNALKGWSQATRT